MPHAFAKFNVLVASPNAHSTKLLVTMLRALKVPGIYEAADTNIALAELKRRTFDVVLVDDGLDGVALTKALRANEASPNRRAAIIMLAAAPDIQGILDARDAGATEFLRKPFSVRHLEQRLTALRNAPRDFIDAPDFHGPDRRRQAGSAGAPKRRSLD